jgi:hypothetical protein
VSNLTSAGGDDVFISKLNSDGSFAWAKSVGGTGNDRGSSLQVDSSGNLHSTGYFSGTADFDPGAEVSNLTSAGGNDVFIIKLALPVTNQAPTDLSLSANTIAENTVIGAGVKIGNITITDPDATGNNNLLTVEGTDAANFEIRNSTELFFIGTSPDFETKPSYTISLKSTDGALTYSEAFTVNVTDVKPKVTISPGTTPVEGGAIGTYTITLDEASPTGGLVINFNTTGSTATLSTDYTLTAGSNITAVTANSFTINQGQSTATFNLNALADAVSDPNETVQINLSSGPGYSLGQNSTALLSPKTDYTVGSSPIWVAAGDFNGDGKLDLATTNRFSGTVSILLRNSANTGFDAKTDFSVGSIPESVAVGDFNGDGKLDLATANYDDGTVSILLRNSANTGFDAKTDFSVGSNPNSVAVGDFNGDGKLDLATANSGNSNSVSILLRNSANTGFDAKTDFSVGSNPTSVAVGDFNGDGKLDLATANYDDGTVSILLRNSANTGFDSQNSVAVGDFNGDVGSNPYSVAVGDFNGDGKLDLAATNFNGNSVSVLLRNSANTGFDTNTDFSVGSNPRSLAVGDFNSDGKLDLAAANANSGSNSVSILLRNSANTGFDAKTDFSVGSLPTSLAVGDVNGDGKLDLATANHIDNSVSVLLNADPSATLTITDAPNAAPTIASGATATFAENGTGTAYQVIATDPESNPITYGLNQTGDWNLFNINSTTGAVTFKTAPNYESPTDAGANNVYDITVTASDSSLTTSKAVAITVTDVNPENFVKTLNQDQFALVVCQAKDCEFEGKWRGYSLPQQIS